MQNEIINIFLSNLSNSYVFRCKQNTGIPFAVPLNYAKQSG